MDGSSLGSDGVAERGEPATVIKHEVGRAVPGAVGQTAQGPVRVPAEQTPQVLSALNTEANIDIRVNNLKSDAEQVADELGAHGATAILTTGDLNGGLEGPALASALAEKATAEAPTAILFGTTYGGRDVAGRLSVKLDASVITNIVDLVESDGLVGVEPVFGGATNVKTKFTGDKPGIFLVRPKSFNAEASNGSSASVEVMTVPELGATGSAKVVSQFVEESDGPKIDEAGIVISGGRGLGEAEKFQLIEDLANKLGGAAGASHGESAAELGNTACV